MAYTAPFVRLSWLFRIQGSAEIAQTSVNLSTSEPTGFLTECSSDPLILTAFFNEMVTLLRSGTPDTDLWANYSQLHAMEVQALNVDGTYLADAVRQDQTVQQGTSPGTLPQSSVVVSLWSGSSIGRANHGRLYLPHTRFEMASNTPFAASTTTNAFATAAADFVGQVNTTAGLVVTGSRITIMSKLGAGTTKDPAFVRVGNITDTQRRRRNRLGESYSQVAV
jgi:hypothetical protein